MPKKVSKSKKAKVKKVRTPEEKLARKERRAAKRISRKELSKMVTRIEEKTVAAIAAVKANVTSDGLPFNESVDNPYSLRAQLAKEAEDIRIAKEEKAAVELNTHRRVKFAPTAKESILSLEA